MTSTVNLTRVDIADIVSKSVSDSELLSNYYLLVSDLLVSVVWYKYIQYLQRLDGAIWKSVGIAQGD